MDSYAMSIQELTKRMAIKRTKLDEDQKNVLDKQKSLRELLKRMHSAASAFDTEDCAQVEKQILLHETELTRLKREADGLEMKRKEREQIFKSMYAAINERTRILEQDDLCMSLHPDMLKYFAKKQINLQSLLKNKIENTISSSHTDYQLQEHLFECGSQP